MRTGHEPEGLAEQVAAALGRLEQTAGKRFGDEDDPLLLSVRSGGRQSMPGMLDTILNLGLNDRSVAGLASSTGNERFAWDSYRRLVQMFGNVALGVEGSKFEDAIASVKQAAGVTADTELSVDDLKELVKRFKALYEFPDGRPGAAHTRDPRRVQVLDRGPSRAVSAHQSHPRRLGNRSQRAADGLRQQGQFLGDGRRLQPRRGHRRANSRRATSWSTRRVRTWSRACARPATSLSWLTSCPRRIRT